MRGNSVRDGTPGRPAPRPLREDQREVEEQRRQQQDRRDVAPVEDPVETIEAAAEREGENAKERDRQPEEMQRGLIARPPQADGAADQQREDADAGEQEIQRARTGRHRRDADVHHLPRPESQHRVADRATFAGGVQRGHDIGYLLNRPIVDRQQQITVLQAGVNGWRSVGDLRSGHAFGREPPQNPVFHLSPCGTRDDVRQPKAEQYRHDEDRQSGPSPPDDRRWRRAKGGVNPRHVTRTRGAYDGLLRSAGEQTIYQCRVSFRSRKPRNFSALCGFLSDRLRSDPIERNDRSNKMEGENEAKKSRQWASGTGRGPSLALRCPYADLLLPTLNAWRRCRLSLASRPPNGRLLRARLA